MRKFFVVGLPRSRTYWISVFLGCTHEGLNYYPDYNEFMKSDICGDSTTCYPWIKDFIDGYPTVVIERDINECFESSLALFPNVKIETLEYIKSELDSIDNCLRVKYEDVSDRLEEIWNYCHSTPFDVLRADLMKDNQMENHSLIKETQRQLEELRETNA